MPRPDRTRYTPFRLDMRNGINVLIHNVCSDCGAAVADTDTHDRWHAALSEAIERAAAAGFSGLFIK